MLNLIYPSESGLNLDSSQERPLQASPTCITQYRGVLLVVHIVLEAKLLRRQKIFHWSNLGRRGKQVLWITDRNSGGWCVRTSSPWTKDGAKISERWRFNLELQCRNENQTDQKTLKDLKTTGSSFKILLMGVEFMTYIAVRHQGAIRMSGLKVSVTCWRLAPCSPALTIQFRSLAC